MDDKGIVLFSIIASGVKVPIPRIRMPVNSTILDLKLEIEKLIGLDTKRQTHDAKLSDDEVIEYELFGESPRVKLLKPPLMDPTGETKIKVAVKFCDEKTNIMINETDLIADLRGAIAKHWGIPSQKTTLFRLSREIKDDGDLFAYCIYDGSEIEMKVVET